MHAGEDDEEALGEPGRPEIPPQVVDNCRKEQEAGIEAQPGVEVGETGDGGMLVRPAHPAGVVEIGVVGHGRGAGGEVRRSDQNHDEKRGEKQEQGAPAEGLRLSRGQ